MTGALVTGAGRGLGREVALRLARRGYVVHVTDVDEVLAAEAAREIGDETGADVFGSALDVRDPEACRKAATLTAEWGHGLDLWVNNAGVLVTGPAREAMLTMWPRPTGRICSSAATVPCMVPSALT